MSSVEALALFADLLEVAKEAREALLVERTRGRPDLREAVRRLLEADERNDPLLDGSGPALMADLLAREMANDLEPGARQPETMPVTVAGYRLVAPLGKGASGVVYSAEQASPKRTVALKILRSDRVSEANRARFIAEAQALSGLHHPSIPYVIEAGPWQDTAYIAMELVRGPTLLDALREASTERVLEVFRDLCLGVEHVHRGGWVHRDLKPSNVRLTEAGLPKLLDFGLALSLGDDGAPGGTANYVSPEQAAGAPGDAAADIYALGAMLYEVLQGRPPIDCANSSLVDQARLKQTEVDFSRLSPPLRIVLDRCLRAAPYERYATARELADELERVRTHHPVVGARVDVWLRGRLWLRRNRRAVSWVGAWMGLAALAGGAWFANARIARFERERAAHVSLATLETSTEQLRAAGRADEAHTVFRIWAELPENRGTVAVSEAWLHHAPLLAEVRDGGERQALANALVTAPDVERRRAALHALVDHFREHGRWVSMERALIALEATGARGAPGDWVVALAGQRRLEEAARLDEEGVGPVLTALAHARPVAARIDRMDPGPDRTWWLGNWRANTLTLADARLEPLRSWAVNGSSGYVPRGLDWAGGLSIDLDGDVRAPVLWDRPRTGSARRVRDLVGPIRAVEAADLDGDGVRELYFGTGAYTRSLYVMRTPDDAPTHAVRVQDRVETDIHGVVSGDFDGDGRLELAVAHGGWRVQQVRMYRWQPGGLALVASVPFDGHLARVPGEKGDALAVMRRVERYGKQVPAGLTMYRLQADGMVSQQTVDAPGPLTRELGGLVAADLDGDGRVDLAASGKQGTTWSGWLLRQTAAGDFRGVTCKDLQVVGALDYDSDGDQELLVQIDGINWILGSGDASVPALARTPWEAPASTGPFQRARELADLGLIDEAAQQLALRSHLAGSVDQEARLWEAAADLERQAGNVERALERLARAIALHPSDDLRGRAARWSAEIHDFEQAYRHLDAMDAPDVDWVAEVRANATHSRLDWSAATRVRPAATQAVPRGFSVDAYGSEGVVLRQAYVADADRLGLEFTLDLSRAEAGVEALIGFEGADGAREMMVRVVSWGGNGQRYRGINCVGGSVLNTGIMVGPAPPGPIEHQVKVRMSVVDGQTYCSVRLDGDVRVSRGEPAASAVPRDLRWAVRLLADPTVPNAAFRGVVTDVRVAGVQAVGHPAPPITRASPADSRTAETLVTLGDADRVASWLRGQPRDVAFVGPALRRDPSRWIPLLRRAWGDDFAPAYARAWSQVVPADARDPEWLRLDQATLDQLPIRTAREAATIHQYAVSLRDAGQAARARVQARKCADARAHPRVTEACEALLDER